MTDQTPEPLTDDHLQMLLDYITDGARPHEVEALVTEVRTARARIAELEAAQANPDAYIAVKRYYSAHAGGPKWNTDAEVIPAAELHGDTREWYRERGYQLLPIVADGDGTRFAATPPTRCQATTASPLIDDRRSLWCELPAGHAGMHHAAVPQPGFPATEVDWDDIVEAGR